MAGKTAYYEKAVLNLALAQNRTGSGYTAWTAPTNIYIALFTVAPTDAYTSGSPNGTEVSDTAYTRQPLQSGGTPFFINPGGTPSQVNNASNAITFPASNGSGGSYTVVAAGIFDATTNGNLIYWNNLTANKTVNTGDIFQFAIGAITVSED